MRKSSKEKKKLVIRYVQQYKLDRVKENLRTHKNEVGRFKLLFQFETFLCCQLKLKILLINKDVDNYKLKTKKESKSIKNTCTAKLWQNEK